MSRRTLTMLAVGDLYLHGQPPAEPLFAKVAPVLRSADVAVGHGKCMFTSRGVNTFPDMGLARVAREWKNQVAIRAT